MRGMHAGTYAPAPTERVHTIASWIHQCLIDRIHAGGVKASSSIQSRVYQSLADAFVAFEQCQYNPPPPPSTSTLHLTHMDCHTPIPPCPHQPHSMPPVGNAQSFGASLCQLFTTSSAQHVIFILAQSNPPAAL